MPRFGSFSMFCIQRQPSVRAFRDPRKGKQEQNILLCLDNLISASISLPTHECRRSPPLTEPRKDGVLFHEQHGLSGRVHLRRQGQS